MSVISTLQSALDAGNFDHALRLCRERLRDEPRDADAHRYLALLYAAQCRPSLAIRAALKACELSPTDPRARSDLGRVHAMSNHPGESLACFRRAVELDPRYADGWHNLGVALRRSGDPQGALAAYKQALALDAKRADTWLNLGNLLVDDNQPENAIESFKRAAALDPKLAQARASLACELSGRGNVSEAEFVFRQAIGLDPKHIQAWFGLGRTLEDLGRADEAERCYRQVLALHPGQPWALGQLLGFSAAEPDEALVRAAHHALNSQATPDGAKALIGYGLGKVYNRRGDYDSAFAAFELANRARRARAGPFDPEEFEQHIARIISVFNADFFAARRRFGIGSDLPVFIIGMPRSGTTLTEQILDCHPQMTGVGELPYLAELAVGLSARFLLNEAWPLCALHLSAMQAHEAAHAYLEKLREKARGQVLRASDKSPLNFFHLGLIALLFPNARVVHCTRNPMDTSLSIYFENFRPNQTYATDLDDIAIYYRGYQRLMAHWGEVLPLKMLELRYEDSVQGIEAQARKLIEFMGLAWDERCLGFHESRRAVQTPSRWQVRQPIYTSSIERWRRYEKHLDALKKRFPECLDA